MARTKEATNKTKTTESTEVVEKKTSNRGRKKGQVVEKELSVIVQLSSKYRVKVDKLNKTLQEKGKAENEEDSDGEDIGWRNIGYFSSWEGIFKKLVDELTRQKAGKKEIITFTEYLEYFEKSNESVKRMFNKVDDIKFKVEEIK